MYRSSKKNSSFQTKVCQSLNLDHEKIVDNKTFWKAIKPCFTDNGISRDNITPAENE